jgi:hypothetical protein
MRAPTLQLGGQVLRDEGLVVGAQLAPVGALLALRVEVEGVEAAHGLELRGVARVGEARVGALAVPGVEGVVADDRERGIGEVGEQHAVEVLVVAEGEQQRVEAAARLVEAVGAPVRGDARRVRLEELGVDDARVEGAAHRKGVADHGPLRLAEAAEHLAEVVHEAGEHEPARSARGAQRFGRLERVVELRELEIGVGLVDQLRERGEGAEHAHPAPPQREVGLEPPAHEVDGLPRVVRAIELAHARAGVRVVAVGRVGLRRLDGLHAAEGTAP